MHFAGTAGAVGYVSLAVSAWALTLIPIVCEVNAPRVMMLWNCSPIVFCSAFVIGGAMAGLVQLHSADEIVVAGPSGEERADPEREPLLPGGMRKAVRVEHRGPCSTIMRTLCRAPLLLGHYITQRAVLRGVAADASLVIVIVTLACATPEQVRVLGGGKEAYARLLCIPFYAVFVYGSSAQGGTGFCAMFFSHAAFTLLGKFSLQV